MSKIIIELLAILVLSFLFSCNRDEEPIDNEEEFEEYLMDEMDAQHIPALATMVFDDESVLYESYLGKSSLETNERLTGKDKFLLASVSKVITATTLLQLYDQGLIALDHPVNDYLDFEVKVPGYSKEITFKMLLTHTSGIADGSALDNQYYYGEDSPVALDFFMKNYLEVGGEFYSISENFHDFEPGSTYEYSNVGSALLAVLVEQLTGEPFVNYCRDNIFTPLGMTNTFWRLDAVTGTIVQPYDYVSGSNQKIEHYTFTDYPNGGLRSTAADLHKLLMELSSDDGSAKLGLSAKTLTEMLTVQFRSGEDQVGLHIFKMDNVLGIWGHDGGEQRVATIMAFHPTNNIGAILLCNQGEADLEDMLLEAYEFGLEIN